MTWRRWFFSAKLAWQQKTLRVLTILTCLLSILVSGYYLWSVVPVARRSGTVVVHYNIYLGIDDVRSWPWVFLLPAIWLACTFIGLLWSYASYQHDPHLSVSLIVFAFFWSLPWIAALFYLSLLNR